MAMVVMRDGGTATGSMCRGDKQTIEQLAARRERNQYRKHKTDAHDERYPLSQRTVSTMVCERHHEFRPNYHMPLYRIEN